ncbi:MAG: response regulator transcription factor [Chlamydiales bacterium]|nr:response regulator transcription factor [Chlamydiales bacterium]
MKKNILLIEDDLDLAQLLVLTLTSAGYTVAHFDNGKDSIKYISVAENMANMSLVILDRMLPDMDGVEILKKLQENKKIEVPVLILSALSADEDVIHGLKLGAIDYMTKPFNLKILMEKISLLIAKAHKWHPIE